MTSLKVHITGYVDSSQPGWVRCAFNDVYGTEWRFIEKVPVVTLDDLDADSAYPVETFIRCEVLNQAGNVVTINLENPDGIAAEDGTAIFEVEENQIISN